MAWGGALVRKILGSRNQRLLKRLAGTVQRINAQEAAVSTWSDERLQQATIAFRERLFQGESTDALLPEAFAVVREASKRVLGMRHFDVQLLGGIVLHQGRIAEMVMGEGKTLVATLPAYLNALSGRGVHVVTVNDYLAQRDAQWMGQLYRFLGLSVGVVIHGMSTEQKQGAYSADIIYATNNELGFDYLRDNMVFSAQERVQRPLHFAIVDEVDSILIDEARTPLIISGPAEDSSELYTRMDALAKLLERQTDPESAGDYWVDEKQKQVLLSETGHLRAEEWMVQAQLIPEDASLYDAQYIGLLHHLYAALKANALFHRDVDYLVQRQMVVIVDEHTGRTMPGRRWSEGLHQAVEAKERVPIQPENQTLASITFQNYFRLYGKLAGMTGTADTEAYEFQEIYGLEVVVIPPNKPSKRIDLPDLVYLNTEGKHRALITDIRACLEQGRPVLVGTGSIEASEQLSALLQAEQITHRVLNAKFHEQEAEIVAEAGRAGCVTIATNMAGRGTDIVLGGSLDRELADLPKDASAADRQTVRSQWQARHDAVVQAGGLHVIGAERHESRRIDNQLRGRSGRQGDPGSSRFYLSMEDNLLRIFASPRMQQTMARWGLGPDQAIESRMVTRSIESAQRKVEARNFDIRKQLLQFDDVANEQRKMVYEQRNALIASDDVSALVASVFEDTVRDWAETDLPPEVVDSEWDPENLKNRIYGLLPQLQSVAWPLDRHEPLADHWEAAVSDLCQTVYQTYLHKQPELDQNMRCALEKNTVLHTLDTLWKDHLVAMDYLRHGIHLRGYAQKDPKQEYKREAFTLFAHMLTLFKHQIVERLCTCTVQWAPAEPSAQPIASAEETKVWSFPKATAQAAAASQFGDKPGRNSPCICGSGRKYKHCCGKLE